VDSQIPGQTHLLAYPPDIDELDERILHAALTQFAQVGIHRASTDDIARRAQINRTTLHRRFGPKKQLIRAAVTYECRRTLARIAAQLDPRATVAERAAHGFVLTVSTLRAHPLLRQALAVDPDDALTWLTRDGADILTIATSFVTAQIRTASAAITDPVARAHHETISAIIVRLEHSLVLTPDAPPNLKTDAELWAFAHAYIAPLVNLPPGELRRN
jgi:AcrR family transcriptional regulator